MYKFKAGELEAICSSVEYKIQENLLDKIPIPTMHLLVESALEETEPRVAKSYRDYRNYKVDFVNMLDNVYRKAQSVMYIGDKKNSNTDSKLVATRRSLIYNHLNSELYKKFFLSREEFQACREGYIYVHDMSSRRDTVNCCLFNMTEVLTGGFEMGNLWYNEPKILDTAFDVIGDVVLSTASQQYGGFTVPEIDKILEPYARKSYKKHKNELISLLKETKGELDSRDMETIEKTALKKFKREFEQGFQGLEYKLNSVGSSRGDYPFITITLGLGRKPFEKMAAITALEIHMGGQGKPGGKKPVLFPKIVFLYDESLHGPGCELEDVFNAGVECSMKTMYPDWLSLTGDSYVAEAYKKYGVVISPMGCRAFLSLWFERGGTKPADDDDKPIVVGRFNLGTIFLHLPMIYTKAQKESRDFYEVLDYYLEMIRKLHKKTIEYIGEMKASTNPVAYCEGGFYGGRLKPTDKIKSILAPCTISFGITALNELQELHNRKFLVEDGAFALEVMEYINKK